ncbi:hypothetical protein [Thalassospira sp.]|uniref:hypothetical protein n=1 Tax=Thalassospira sp. TaxID=1912094 RepID=UPI001B139A57|nr:hypothetical protein [Thalassospira sp.]MBO6773770.1 hypothetical protein [Thalassospira sp.]
MAKSGIEWVDIVFNWCVRLLYDWATFFGITYEEINIWVFIVIWPIVTLAMAIWIVLLLRQNRRLKAHIAT